MQCNVPCLYQVCEAGSNGSWCGRGPRVLLCSRAEPGHLRWVWPAMAQRLQPTKRVLASVSLSLSLSPLHLKSLPQSVTDWEKRSWKWWEHDNPGPNHSGFGSAFVQWTDLLQINKSTCRNVSYSVFFLSFFLFWWQPWCFATWHALVAAGLYFWVVS